MPSDPAGGRPTHFVVPPELAELRGSSVCLFSGLSESILQQVQGHLIGPVLAALRA
jgi:hypothetical protein